MPEIIWVVQKIEKTVIKGELSKLVVSAVS